MITLTLAAVARSFWLIDERYGQAVFDALVRRHKGKATAEEIETLIAANPQRLAGNHETRAAAGGPGGAGAGGVAVIQVIGTIAPRADAIQNASAPGMSASGILSRFNAAMSNPEVGAIVLDIESWGGTVFHVPELGDRILKAREQKPVFAVANPYAASAAFWIGASAGKFYASKSGEVGSVGVMTAHENISAALEKEGVSVELMHSTDAPFKVEGNRLAPLSDEARANIQAELDRYHAMFVKALADGRGVTKAHVRDNFGQGRTVAPDRALEVGMIDGIKSLDEVIVEASKAAQRASRSAGRSAAASRLDLV